MGKVVRAGKVAVLCSKSPGVGWYTLNREAPDCLFDAQVVNWVLNGKPSNAIPDFQTKFGASFLSKYGSHHLRADWVPEGTRFSVVCQHGNESVVRSEQGEFVA